MNENQKYQTFAVLKDGTRQPIDAESIIIQLEEEEIEIPLTPLHPVFQGKLTLVTGSAIQGRENERGGGTQLVIEPGASNVIHITPKKL
ncbi:hypothetical protein WH221_03760 [Chryseobacterium culicis]|uniref:Uncharacterized protein n=1 Tax=Chryseobacterium culicis TaxID=680127 RepID=A0A2S9CY50_CHRCI|nr:hypothetical protein [Chryseobacterium culicis]PRB85376.1 hypothetical protein CQ022_03715 [Chryseobacterium culicis]PRB90904.1 hypothetical protein CQ033_09275 [Chryseobacterium culicis]